MELCRQLGERLGLKEGEQVGGCSYFAAVDTVCLCVYRDCVLCSQGLPEALSAGLVCSSGFCGASVVR